MYKLDFFLVFRRVVEEIFICGKLLGWWAFIIVRVLWLALYSRMWISRLVCEAEFVDS